MAGYEVEGRVRFRGMFQEVIYPVCGGCSRASDAKARAYRLQGSRCVIVQSEVAFFSWYPVPEINIRFIPDFEVPLRDFIDAIALG